MTLPLGFALTGLVLVFLLALIWQARKKVRDERASRPRALAHAELVYMETLFRIREPFRLVAKVDRVYRLLGGSLVLVELKTRRRDRPYLTDVIQLSAQRLAVQQQTGEVVEPYAFVSVLGPGRGERIRSHRVALLEADALIRLHRRRRAILARQEAPAYAAADAACRGCALRSKCDRFGGRA
ncbi:PD-(D/E)XK nuclease family protein [Xenophilus azovorans]|uniref:PD-(D/E)XK nuclease family protein n=1 Tax=Xenophilus azovorans TaxID=151755 RepID=UPI000570BE0E|nr:PD-(D/E)XK nuclease family protein [Xenophilus azovorans]